DLAALDVVTLNTTEQAADVVARLALVQQLAEHLDTGADRLAGLLDADDFDFVANLDDASLDTAGDHGTAALDAEDVFHRHQERQVRGARRHRDVAVQCFHELPDALVLRRVRVNARALQGLEAGAADDRDVVAGEALLAQQLTKLQLDEVEELLVFHHVYLVQEDDHGGHFDLAGQKDVFARLRHG